MNLSKSRQRLALIEQAMELIAEIEVDEVIDTKLYESVTDVLDRLEKLQVHFGSELAMEERYLSGISANQAFTLQPWRAV